MSDSGEGFGEIDVCRVLSKSDDGCVFGGLVEVVSGGLRSF